jgi:hypothetical protein
MSKGLSILAIGDVEEWEKAGNSLPSNNKVVFAEFQEVTDVLLATIKPAIIISPLLTRSFDCIDLAQHLQSLGYKGQYRAMAATLPNPTIVRREIKTLCPDIDFDVIALPESKTPHPN